MTFMQLALKKIITIYATCISKACKDFVSTLDGKAGYKIDGMDSATIKYSDNHSIYGDFIIMRA